MKPMSLGETYQRVGDDGWRFVTDAELAMQSLAKHAWRRALVLAPNAARDGVGLAWATWWVAFSLEE